MLGSDIIRDINIKRTFTAVDNIEKYPIDLIKITLKCDYEECDFKNLTKTQYTELIKSFITILKSIMKGKVKNIRYLGVSSEYRLDPYWATSIVVFKFFMIGYDLKSYEDKILRETDQITQVFGGEANVTSETIHDREKLFFELYPNTMLDEVVNLLLNVDIQNLYPEELLELMMSPITFKSPSEFVEYFLK